MEYINILFKYKQITFKIMLIILALMLQKVVVAVSIELPLSITIVWILTFLIFLYCYYLKKKIIIPVQFYLCQLWMCGVLISAIFIAPTIIEYNFKIKRIAYEFIYYEVLFYYLLVGYNIAEVKLSCFLLKTISYMAVAVASISIFAELFNINFLREHFYLSGAGERFSGITGNPNTYISIVFIALSYFGVTQNEKIKTKVVAICVLVFSIFASGSKGGLATLFIYGLIGSIVSALKGNRNQKIIGFVCTVIFCGGMFFVLVFHKEVSTIMLQYASLLPGMERVASALADPMAVLSGSSGSLRIQCWYGAYLIIKKTLLLGAGIGSHGRILETIGYEYSYLTPHNVYLELIAQSGIVIGLIILILIYKLLKKTNNNRIDEINVLRHAMYLLLLDSMYTATNWTIAFWFIVGMLCYGANHTGE